MGFFGSFARASLNTGRSVSRSTGQAIFNALQRSRSKRDVKKLYQQVSDSNFANRGVYLLPGGQTKQQLRLISGDDENDVYDYTVPRNQNPGDVGWQFVYGSSDEPEGTIVSGGSTEDRVAALVPFVVKAREKGMPVIAIHYGNSKLEKMLSVWSNDYEIISRQSCFYDPFRGMPPEDIAFILYQAMPEGLATPTAATLLQAVTEIMAYTEDSTDLETLARFPILGISSALSSLLANKEIDKTEYDRLNGYFLAGSSELNTVKLFLSNLYRESVSVYGNTNRKRSNVRAIINKKGTLSIDIGNTSNANLTALVVSHLFYLQSQGKQFVLLLDGLSIANCSRINDLLRNCTYAVSSNDFISSISGGKVSRDELFTEITGSVTRTVLFAHSSGVSAGKWSEYLGMYKKIRIRSSISQSTSYDSMNYSKGLSVDEKDEARVPPGTFALLPPKWACIYSAEGILFAQINEPQP